MMRVTHIPMDCRSNPGADYPDLGICFFSLAGNDPDLTNCQFIITLTFRIPENNFIKFIQYR